MHKQPCKIKKKRWENIWWQKDFKQNMCKILKAMEYIETDESKRPRGMLITPRTTVCIVSCIIKASFYWQNPWAARELVIDFLNLFRCWPNDKIVAGFHIHDRWYKKDDLNY